jgi:hypothetical protein
MGGVAGPSASAALLPRKIVTVETSVWGVLLACREAVREGVPTYRPADDKEFHFQRWVESRIREAGFDVPETGRVSYPDFPIVGLDEAYEVKGITSGSRERDFDCNSTLPEGVHQGHQMLYLFGRYEGPAAGERPRVLDLAIVHGTLLNAGGSTLPRNSSFRGLGSYGDVLLRARKMFVAFTPYGLLSNLRDHCTLVLPVGWEEPPTGFECVGEITRHRVPEQVVGYAEDFVSGTLTPVTAAHDLGVTDHVFKVWRVAGDGTDTVELVMPATQALSQQQGTFET